MKTFKTFALIMLSLMIALFAGAAGASYGLNGLAVGGVAFASSFVPRGVSGALCSGINIEIWHNFIMENLFKNNAFLEKSVDVSGFVLNGSVVHIPQAGNPSSVVRNRQNLPASIKRRSDTDITYTLDEFTTDPVAILRADEVELSYDKMASVLANDLASLKQTMAEWMLYNWRPEGTVAAGNMILTTGSATAAHLSGATGNRKLVTLADLKSAQKAFNKLNLPENDRWALFDADMFDQLTSNLEATQYRDFSQYYDPANGVVGRLYGFNIITRSSALRLATGLTVKTPDAAETTTDKAGALIWQSSMLEKAVGNILAFENTGDPTFYGDIYSFLVRAGGRKRFSDGRGVIALVQDAA